jgi:large subunit ribosomal protein L21
MYAIVNINGTQVRAEPDQVLEVPRLTGEPGQTLTFDNVMLVGEGDKVQVGRPYVAKATVSAEIVEHFRGEKVHIVKYKKTKDYHRRRGYRSELTRIKVSAISA